MTSRVPAACAIAAILLCGCRASVPRDSSSAPRPRGPQQPPSQLAKDVIFTAKSYLPDESDMTQLKVPKDCSDFVAKVFSDNGVQLPRTSEGMSLAGARVASYRDLRMGDLVFFSGMKINRIVGHVGIYINKGLFIHLTRPEDGVTMDSMFNDYYKRRYLTGRRVIP